MTTDERTQKRAAAAARAKTRGPPRLPEWPPGKPRPAFASEAEEVQFLSSYSFGDFWAAKSKRQSKKRLPRDEVYRLRLTGEEREALEARAREEHVPSSAILRDLIRGLRTQIQVAPGATAQLPNGAGGFAHLNVKNLGPPLTRVRCWVQFFRRDAPSRALFAEEMPARWSWAPEPFSGNSEIDYFKVSLGHVADFAPREEHAVAVALKLADGSCWGWTPDSYVYGGRHPGWQLPPEPLLVRVRLFANGRDYFEQFALDAHLAPQEFGLRSAEGRPPSRLTSSLKAEVEQVTRLKLVR